MYNYIGGIIRNEGGILFEINGMPDHIHLLIKMKPTNSMSDMMRIVKSNSSKWLNEQNKSLRKFGWQNGYAAFTLSQSKFDQVAGYIRRQKEHHRKTSFQEELLAILKRHGVEFDEKYIWT